VKLPDFTLDEELTRLRNAMQAAFREFTPAAPVNTLTADEVERLKNEGIEIPIEDVGVLNDGTHVYKGRRVIVYIRDVPVYGDRYSLPKYHLAMCETLARMIEEKRYQKRYVVATRDDGKFNIQKIRGDNVLKSDEALAVCQHCLDELKYKGFSLRMKSAQRATAVHDFSINTFFEEYGRTCVWATPKFDADHAPPNVYSAHFYRIAKAIKEQRGYRCESISCKIDLSNPQNQKFLHAHHIDADKSDSHPTNIRLLCIRCHATMFQHSHLKGTPDYEKFCRNFPLPRRR